MSEFYDIDFLDVESKKSGDAIVVRYGTDGVSTIQVTDGGYQDTGPSLRDYIRKHHANPSRIDRVIVTHPDGDHAGGLRTILEDFQVSELWMLRPWQYAAELLPRFSRFTSIENLAKRLKDIYPNIAALEELAIQKRIPIKEPFQGALIGAFTVLSPSRSMYLDLIIESDRTPEAVDQPEQTHSFAAFYEAAKAAVTEFVSAIWGAEVFSSEETSAENEMSVVQYAFLCGKKILLTGDAGRKALAEAAAFTPHIGLQLPGIDCFQVPHHGSRRNVSTELLDLWLGKKLENPPKVGEEKFSAYISSAKADKEHPRKSVVRAMIHRGAKVLSTEGKSFHTYMGISERNGWSTVVPLTYPQDQEK